MAQPSSAPSGVVFYGRDERVRRFGIDCGDELLWRNKTWAPGGEFCKTLTVKNVGKETIKLKYAPPSTSFFSMDFPEEKTLSPGMSLNVQVVFRPVRVEPYSDHIEFTVKNKKLRWTFYVPVRAQMSRVSVSVPSHEDFGFAPIAETAERAFEVSNTGTEPVEYRWEVSAPFSVEPAQGVIEERQQFRARFAPSDASVLVSQALLHVKGLESSPVLFKMSGIGKYPFVSLSEKRLELGECLPGGSVEREVLLRNQSQVAATFQIRRLEHDLLPVFTLEPCSGCVAPGQSVTLSAVFAPRVLGQYSCDHFSVLTPGGNAVVLECAGDCVGPATASGRSTSSNLLADASLGAPSSSVASASSSASSGADGEDAPEVVQFGQCPVASGADAGGPTRVVYISNKSNARVRYQFLADPRAEFEIVEPQGFVPALLDKAVTIRFRASLPGNYVRRVFCALQDQMPLYFDLVGTAFDPLLPDKRPQPMLFRHVAAHRRRAACGLARETPEQLLEQLECDQELRQRVAATVFPEQDRTPSRSGGATQGQLEVCRQLLEQQAPTARGGEAAVVVLSAHDVDFGAGSRLKADKRVFEVTNRHRSKVVCGWTVNWGGSAGAGAGARGDCPFAVFPESQDIAPGQTAEFRVLFKPGQEHMYYHATASAYVYVKANRSFRLVNDAAFVPPFHLSLNLFGHTFTPGVQQFLPKAAVLAHSAAGAAAADGAPVPPGVTSGSASMLELPVCHLGEAVYATAVLDNTGDTPIKFDLSLTSQTFEAAPRFGLVQPGQFQILTFKSKPRAEGEHRCVARCVLNNSGENAYTFHLLSVCAVPRVKLLEPGELEETRAPAAVAGEAPALSGAGAAAAVPAASPAPASGSALAEPLTALSLLHSSRSPAAASASPRSSQLTGRSRGSWLEAAAGEEAHMFLRRTCIGLVTTRELVVKNASRVPMDFEWSVPRRLRSVVSVTPAQGRLRGNEAVTSRWTFAPQAAGHFEGSALLVCRSIAPGGYESRRVLRIVGEGGEPFVTVTPEIDVGTVLANATSDGTLELVNHAGSEVGFELAVAAQPTGESESEGGAELRLSTTSGTIPARSSIKVRLEFAPTRCGTYRFAVRCRCGVPKGTTTAAAAAPPPPQLVVECAVTGAAADPVLVVEDARSTSASTSELWRQFSVAHLNQVLASPIGKAEVAFLHDTGERSARSATPPEDLLQCATMRFLPGPLGAPTQSVALQLKNPGKLPVDFRFKFPNESDIDVEPWAAAGEPKESELRQSYMLVEKIFDVEPRRGSLGPGDCAVVRFTYRHKDLAYEGVHDLNVLLLLRNGKQMRVRLEGRTLDPQRPAPALFCASGDKHRLQPQRIGLHHAPAQLLELLNPSTVPLLYEVDPRSLEQLARDNYSFAVLEVTNPAGLVPPGQRVGLRLRFRPIEAKEYRTVLRLLVRPAGSDSTAVAPLDIELSAGGFQSAPERAAALASLGDAPPEQQLLPQRGQMASLSLDALRFGDVAAGALESRIAFLRNMTAGKLSFRWAQGHPLLARRLVSVEPAVGVLEPGAFAIVRVTLDAAASDEPELVDADLRCDVEPYLGGAAHEPSIESLAQLESNSLAHPSFRTESRASSNRNFKPQPAAAALKVAHQHAAAHDDASTLPMHRQALYVHLYAAVVHQQDMAPGAGEAFFRPTPLATTAAAATATAAAAPAPASPEDAEPDRQPASPPARSPARPEQGEEEQLEALLRSALTAASDEISALGAQDPLFRDLLSKPRNSPASAQQDEAQRRRLAALKDPACQRIIQQALDNTVLNLVHEAAHGEIDITTFRTLLLKRD